jgi:hypothetical protein
MQTEKKQAVPQEIKCEAETGLQGHSLGTLHAGKGDREVRTRGGVMSVGAGLPVGAGSAAGVGSGMRVAVGSMATVLATSTETSSALGCCFAGPSRSRRAFDSQSKSA